MAKFKISFSRHAKRRIKLYKIDERDIIEKINSELKLQNRLLYNVRVEFNTTPKYNKIKYPLKIVVEFRGYEIFIITSYPLKKGRK